jgi:hypothetical protein
MRFRPTADLRQIVAACASIANIGSKPNIPFIMAGHIWGVHPEGYCFSCFKAPSGVPAQEGHIFTGSSLDGAPSHHSLYLVTDTFEILPNHPVTNAPPRDIRPGLAPPRLGSPIPPFNPILLQAITNALRIRYSIPLLSPDDAICSLHSAGPTKPLYVVSHREDPLSYVGGILPIQDLRAIDAVPPFL